MCEFVPFNFSGRETAIFRKIINANYLRSFFVDVESEEQAAKHIKVRWIILIIFARLKKKIGEINLYKDKQTPPKIKP